MREYMLFADMSIKVLGGILTLRRYSSVLRRIVAAGEQPKPPSSFPRSHLTAFYTCPARVR
jgi:hypothetical protein